MLLGVDQASWPEIFRAFANRFRETIHVGLPGTIVSFDHTTRLATIQLGVQQPIDGDPAEGWQSIDPLTDVPVVRPRGGGFALSLPMAAGDAVQVNFCEADPSGFRRSGQPSPPDTFKRFGLYAWAVPCDWLDSAQGPPGEAGKAILEGAGGIRLVVDGTAVHVGGDIGSQALTLYPGLVAAATAGIGGAVPNDGGKAAFTAFKGALTSAQATKAKGI